MVGAVYTGNRKQPEYSQPPHFGANQHCGFVSILPQFQGNRNKSDI